MSRLGDRLRAHDGEAGLTLIELLVASLMSVILVGAATSMLISAVRTQPAISKKAQNVTTARWQLERVVRDLRNGIQVEAAQPNEVSLRARVRRTSCGGSAQSSPSADAITCLVTYRCAGSSCTRSEVEPGAAVPATGSPALTGIDNPGEVFCFVPSDAADPTTCGAAGTQPPTYVGVNLEVPNPDGPGRLTISDGGSLRTAVFIRRATG